MTDHMAEALAAAGLDPAVYEAELAAVHTPDPRECCEVCKRDLGLVGGEIIPAPIRVNVEVRRNPLTDHQEAWLGDEWIGNLVPWGEGYLARGVPQPVSRVEAIDYLLAAYRVSREAS